MKPNIPIAREDHLAPSDLTEPNELIAKKWNTDATLRGRRGEGCG